MFMASLLLQGGYESYQYYFCSQYCKQTVTIIILTSFLRYCEAAAGLQLRYPRLQALVELIGTQQEYCLRLSLVYETPLEVL